MKTPDDARFIVGNEGKDAVIRHVHPDSCSLTFNKRDAWKNALRRAQPAQGRKKKKPEPGRIIFQDIEGFRTDVTPNFEETE